MSRRSRNLFLYVTAKGKKIYYSDVVKALKKGIKKGETIFVHSDLTRFGKCGTIKDKNLFLKLIIEAFKQAVGRTGTLIMPTFSYSFTKNEVYDVEQTPSTVGLLTEYFRNQPGTLRSIHPIFSVTAWGKDKDYFCKHLSHGSFDKNSVFGRLHKKKGKLVFFGAAFDFCTYIHYVEQTHGVPYRFVKTFTGKIKQGQRVYEDRYTFFVRYMRKNVVADLAKLEAHLLKKGLMKASRLGSGRILQVSADAVFKEGVRLLDRDIYFFLRGKPYL